MKCAGVGPVTNGERRKAVRTAFVRLPVLAAAGTRVNAGHKVNKPVHVGLPETRIAMPTAMGNGARLPVQTIHHNTIEYGAPH